MNFYRRRHNWDTVSQPENNLFEPEIQPNLPENCQISALFRTLKIPRSLSSYTANPMEVICRRDSGFVDGLEKSY